MRTKHMPARLESLHDLVAFIIGFAGQAGSSKEMQNRIELVAEEALVNIIKNAYPSSPGDIEVRCMTGEEAALTVEIRDAGLAFDPLQSATPDVGAGLDERKVGGLGVFFIRRMTDGLAYRRDQDQNIFTMTFRER